MSSGAGDDDDLFMAEALRLGEQGLGRAAPNPSVGAVVVRAGSDDIVGRGFTQQGGRPHAEFVALQEAGELARGGTLYATLEPCSHAGRGPACADVIIAAGIGRAVVAIGDPDQRVAGNGLDRLRMAGLEVTLGTLAAAARWLNLGHILRVTEGRPFVQLKIAVDRHGRTPLAMLGHPQFVTGDQARAEVHRMRAQADAVLTGIGTVLADDPDLRPRIATGAGPVPIRIVLDSAGRLPPTSKLVTTASADAPVWRIVRKGEARQSGGAAVTFEVDWRGSNKRLDLATVLRRLATEGLTRVMVEAGPTLVAALIAADLVDEVVVLQSQSVTCADGHCRLPFVSHGLELLDSWTLAREAVLGGDRLAAYRHPRHDVPSSAGAN